MMYNTSLAEMDPATIDINNHSWKNIRDIEDVKRQDNSCHSAPKVLLYLS